MLKDKVLRELESRINALKIKDKDEDNERKVLDEVFDHSTLLTIYKMFTNDIIDTIEFSISTGKEANVFYATSKQGPKAVKIYRTTITTFKTINKYIFGDPRFKGLKGNRRRIIFQWAQKEFKNLSKALSVKVRVPTPIVVKNNVLVMEYIGTRISPAPALREVSLEDPKAIYDDLIEQLRRLYHKARLVHSDLSEFNILMHENKPYIIDMGQSVLREHPMAWEFLERDLRNLGKFFKKKGLKIDQAELQRSITEPTSLDDDIKEKVDP